MEQKGQLHYWMKIVFSLRRIHRSSYCNIDSDGIYDSMFLKYI